MVLPSKSERLRILVVAYQNLSALLSAGVVKIIVKLKRVLGIKLTLALVSPVLL